jgi:pimeloyl-ACP methyl ester carboxylesterase
MVNATLELVRLQAADFSLAALDYAPRRPRDVSIVFGHGYSSSKHNLDSLASFLAAHGYRIISVDFPGPKLGASGGTLRSFEDLLQSMDAAAAYARERYGPTVYVLGHSMGAMTALRCCARDQTLSGAVSIATGYGRLRALQALTARGTTDLRSAYVDGLTLPQVAEYVERDQDAILPALAGRPVLYIAAERDMMVGTADVQALFDRAPEPKSFATVASDHTNASEYSRGAVLAWLNALHPRE